MTLLLRCAVCRHYVQAVLKHHDGMAHHAMMALQLLAHARLFSL